MFLRHATLERESDLDKLSAIVCPTLVIGADTDALRSVDEALELRDGIAGATLTLIERSGHMVPIEQPARLVAVVVPWLREQAVPGHLP